MIHAQYESRCPVCDEMISEDDEIEKLEGEWVHRQCWEDEERGI